MLRIVVLLGLMVFALGLFYQNFNYPHLRFVPITERLLAPFDLRIRYRIGELDPRFGLSHIEAQQLALEATQIWQQADKNIFVYDPDARLVIDFIYDQRQIHTQTRLQQHADIEQQQQLWQQRHQQLQTMRQQPSQLEQQLKQKQDILNQATTYYNQQVRAINQQGGASPEQRHVLEQQRLYLSQQRQLFNQDIAIHSSKIETLNQEVNRLNTLNQQLSQQISAFNRQFVGKQFDKGIFNGKQIIIYEFSSIEDLRLTLAHEFGHALGLGHHDDPYGLMYPILQKQTLDNFQLSNADFALLESKF